MLKILKNSSVEKTIKNLSVELIELLNKKYNENCGLEDRVEYPVIFFWRDLVYEVSYGDTHLDGNWHEFAAQWGLDSRVFNAVLDSMRQNGFNSNLEKW